MVIAIIEKDNNIFLIEAGLIFKYNLIIAQLKGLPWEFHFFPQLNHSTRSIQSSPSYSTIKQFNIDQPSEGIKALYSPVLSNEYIFPDVVQTIYYPWIIIIQ